MSQPKVYNEATQLSADVKTLSNVVRELVINTESFQRREVWYRRILWSLAIVSILVVALIIGLVWTQVQLFSYVKCQAQYNEINNRRSRILTEVGANERKAERVRSDALDAISLDPAAFTPQSQRTPEDSQRLLQLAIAYRESIQMLREERIKADKARAENPLPSPPTETCAD